MSGNLYFTLFNFFFFLDILLIRCLYKTRRLSKCPDKQCNCSRTMTDNCWRYRKCHSKCKPNSRGSLSESKQNCFSPCKASYQVPSKWTSLRFAASLLWDIICITSLKYISLATHFFFSISSILWTFLFVYYILIRNITFFYPSPLSTNIFMKPKKKFIKENIMCLLIDLSECHFSKFLLGFGG